MRSQEKLFPNKTQTQNTMRIAQRLAMIHECFDFQEVRLCFAVALKAQVCINKKQ